MTQSDAIIQVGNVLSVLSDSWRKGWNDTLGRFFEPEHDRRCRSCILQMQAVIHAKKPLMSDYGARLHSRHSQHIFTIPDIAHIVMKQLRAADLCPNFSPTTHARQFYSQDDLPGLENSPRLICGPVLSHDWTALDGIYLTFPNKEGRANNWVLNISDHAAPVDNGQLQIDLEDDKMPLEKPRFIPKDVPYQKPSTA